jgi:hypothetical protein
MTGVSDEFRDAAIEDYVVFILQLGWAPSEIYYARVDEIKGLEVWRDMFSKELNTGLLATLIDEQCLGAQSSR